MENTVAGKGLILLSAVFCQVQTLLGQNCASAAELLSPNNSCWYNSQGLCHTKLCTEHEVRALTSRKGTESISNLSSKEFKLHLTLRHCCRDNIKRGDCRSFPTALDAAASVSLKWMACSCLYTSCRGIKDAEEHPGAGKEYSMVCPAGKGTPFGYFFSRFQKASLHMARHWSKPQTEFSKNWQFFLRKLLPFAL